MVAGHLQEKKGLFYIVLSYQDVDHNRKTKWIPTNLPVKGNKKRAEQMLWEEEYRKVCGRSYCKDYLDYICVNPLGERIKCSYLTSGFPNFLEQHGMRRIRFHDLRHSCASLLLANGVPMKQIQEWLGHSDFSTTANVYAYLDYHSKITSAEAILTGLKMQPEA